MKKNVFAYVRQIRKETKFVNVKTIAVEILNAIATQKPKALVAKTKN